MTFQLLTPKEAADKLRLSKNVVLRYIKEGKITAIKVNSKVVRINERELYRFENRS